MTTVAGFSPFSFRERTACEASGECGGAIDVLGNGGGWTTNRQRRLNPVRAEQLLAVSSGVAAGVWWLQVARRSKDPGWRWWCWLPASQILVVPAGCEWHGGVVRGRCGGQPVGGCRCGWLTTSSSQARHRTGQGRRDSAPRDLHQIVSRIWVARGAKGVV